ncbi:MAG: AMP-binding protein [Desulfobacteraceae bacterium]|nr:AMP-binding protein [Desulfobacteraceae bacterium]
MGQDLASFIRQKAAIYKDRVFLKDYGEENTITFNGLDEITDRLAEKFAGLGLEKGDRIALLHPNHSDFILCCFAVIKAGGVAVPVNTVYSPPEIAHIINDSGAFALVTTDELYPKVREAAGEMPGLEKTLIKKQGQSLEEVIAKETGGIKATSLPDCRPEDLAVMFYTSGTTGKPKGVMLTHGNITFSGPNVAQSYGLRENDVTIAALPLVHVFANASPVLGSLSSGGTVIVMERFKTDSVFEAIERYGVTWYPGVPTMFHYLLAGYPETERDTGSLRMLLSGGASLSVEVLKELEEKFGTKVLEVYGLTESTGLVTANPVYGERKQGSVGVVVSGVDSMIVDEKDRRLPVGEIGELVFSGPNACTGYWNLPEQTNDKIQNGWVRTGDHAYRDEDGYFFIVGRDKELIITGGYNIYPREIEEVLYRHPDVHEAAVISVAHPEKGKIPKAFAVLRPGTRCGEEELLDYCRQNLAPYKIPALAFLDELPKNSTGKIMKNQLATQKTDGE